MTAPVPSFDEAVERVRLAPVTLGPFVRPLRLIDQQRIESFTERAVRNGWEVMQRTDRVKVTVYAFDIDGKARVTL